MPSPLTPRDPVNDHLLTPQNCAQLIIDYQPIQVTSVASRDRRELVSNIVAVARVAKLYDLPGVLSTVNVKTGINQPMITQITDIVPGEPIDRTTVNAWEDEDFYAAVKATRRKKLLVLRIVDRGLPLFPRVGRHQGKLRSLPDHRRRWGHFARGAPIGGAPHDSGGRKAGELGPVDLRAAARLAAQRYRRRFREDPL